MSTKEIKLHKFKSKPSPSQEVIVTTSGSAGVHKGRAGGKQSVKSITRECQCREILRNLQRHLWPEPRRIGGSVDLMRSTRGGGGSGSLRTSALDGNPTSWAGSPRRWRPPPAGSGISPRGRRTGSRVAAGQPGAGHLRACGILRHWDFSGIVSLSSTHLCGRSTRQSTCRKRPHLVGFYPEAPRSGPRGLRRQRHKGVSCWHAMVEQDGETVWAPNLPPATRTGRLWAGTESLRWPSQRPESSKQEVRGTQLTVFDCFCYALIFL